jgi:hypothetical protein
VTKCHDHTNTSGEKLPDDLDGDNHKDGVDRAEVIVSTHAPAKADEYDEPEADEFDHDTFAESIRKSYKEMLEEESKNETAPTITEVNGDYIKIFDNGSENKGSQNKTSANSDSDSDSDSDYDEFMKKVHDELTRKEMERLEARRSY